MFCLSLVEKQEFLFFFRRQAIEALVTLSTRDDAPDPRDGVDVTSRLRTWRVVMTIVTTVGRNTANMIHFRFNEMPLSLMMRHGREPSKSFSPMTQYSTYMVYWAVDFWTFQTQPLISCIDWVSWTHRVRLSLQVDLWPVLTVFDCQDSFAKWQWSWSERRGKESGGSASNEVRCSNVSSGNAVNLLKHLPNRSSNRDDMYNKYYMCNKCQAVFEEWTV